MPLTADVLKRSWRATYNLSLEPVGPAWLPWVWSTLLALPWALAFTVAGFALYAKPEHWGDPVFWWQAFSKNFVVALSVSTAIHLLFALTIGFWGRPTIRCWSPGRQRLYFITIPILGVLIGWGIGFWLIEGHMLKLSANAWAGFGLLTVLGMLASNAHYSNKVRAEMAERRATEAQLCLLQGQIEPHFLFNTLAHVQTLIEVDPAKAQQMLEAFVAYLRSSFSGLRAPQQTLGQEAAMIHAYLQVLALRMEDRLQWQIDVPPDLAATPLPPLLLQPLVENAITHGLEPKIEGGRIVLQARREGGLLHLTVSDTGLGLDQPHARPRGQGSALNNIRARLAEQWGSQATLTLSDAAQGGTVAQLTLPLSTA
ncbi:MAG: sensor histidine kinase [Ideonella sp. MAG2]|nr:MAG: sensor histidine kinase [Ideonella sp. MAG2]